MTQPLRSQFEAHLAAETVAHTLTDEAVDVAGLERVAEISQDLKVWAESEIAWQEKRAGTPEAAEVP